MISSILAAITAVTGLSSWSKVLMVLAAAAVAAAAATAVYGVWHHEVYKSGYDRAILDIARADAKAVGKASDLRNVWRACRDADRAWDQTTGRCQ